ncbi:MAG: DUF3810 family protein [Vicinamibacterales bacterium]
MSIIRASIVGLALLALFFRLPAELVERVYSCGAYLWVQRLLTHLSNQVAFALLDVAVAVAVGAALFLVVRFVRRVRRRPFRAAWATVASLVVGAAAIYLLFQAVWGLNYQRVPLTEKLEYSAAPPGRAAVARLASEAGTQLNSLHGDAHSGRWPEWDEMIAWLGPGFYQTQRHLTGGATALPGRPKWSVFTIYFQRAGVDGMTDPLFLEVLVNQTLLPFERPFVVAHEWAHLAGYANEAEANFIGWLTCLQGPVPARYSGWLFLFSHALAALPEPDRGHAVQMLDAGPLNDLRGIQLRLSTVRPIVRAVGWDIYDRYLRANRVDQGVRSYDRAVLLILGTRFKPGWVPVRRGE